MHRIPAAVALALLLSAPLALAALPAQAPDAVVAALPQGRLSGYAPPVVPLLHGQRLVYLNGDVSTHDVVAYEDAAPGPRPWCGTVFTITGECPLFWSPLLEVGQTAEVEGVADAEPLRAYRFYCTLHQGMQGELVVVDG